MTDYKVERATCRQTDKLIVWLFLLVWIAPGPLRRVALGDFNRGKPPPQELLLCNNMCVFT